MASYLKRCSQITDFGRKIVCPSSSVPQGSIIGTLLFVLYINNLPGNLDAHISLYSTDVTAANITNLTVTLTECKKNHHMGILSCQCRYVRSFPLRCVRKLALNINTLLSVNHNETIISYSVLFWGNQKNLGCILKLQKRFIRTT